MYIPPASVHPTTRKRGRVAAFSLIELLVVIGIIAVLLGILLPVIGKARRQASMVVCFSQTRQIITAVTLYSNDNDNWLPTPGWLRKDQQDFTAGHRQSNWLYNEDLRAGTFKPSDAMNGTLYKYVRNIKVYRCPDDHGPWLPSSSQNCTSYIMNGAVCQFDFGGSPPTDVLTTSILRYKSGDVILWEVAPFDLGNGNDSSSYPNEKQSDRHSTGSNVGCIDGHVETIPSVLWQQILNDPNKNKLWCNTRTVDGRP